MNIFTATLDEPLDEHGFRHRAATARLDGAARIRAIVYAAEAGVPIWPYHFHRGLDELLYVIGGAPVLREPDGERALAPGELVRFGPGPDGAHTLSGPGRFVIFSGEHGPGRPFTTAYPDSGKVSGADGVFLADSTVGYWHGEGTAGPLPADPPPPGGRREPPPGPPALHAEITDLAPADAEYHSIYGRERWLALLDGAATLRRPDGEQPLRPGDLVCLPDGPAGAHALTGAGRVLRVGTTGVPANVHFPDSGRWEMRNER